MAIALTVLVPLGILVAIAMEILAVGQRQRDGVPPNLAFRRFRRRVKAAFVLGAATLFVVWLQPLRNAGLIDPRGVVLYTGMLFILLLWLLILAARDFKEVALDVLAEEQRARKSVTEAALASLDDRQDR